MNAYQWQQEAFHAAVERGLYSLASRIAEVNTAEFCGGIPWYIIRAIANEQKQLTPNKSRREPERSGTTEQQKSDKKTLTAPRKCGIIKAILRHLRRVKRNQEVKKMYKWIEIYSIDNCIPDGMTAKVKATYNETEEIYEISRRAFLQACKRIGTDEHHARCKEDVYTQTSRGDGYQWYNLKDGIRPLTW